MKKPAELVKEFRIKLGMSGEEFGEKLGISQQHISRIELGTNGVSKNVLKTLSLLMSKKDYSILEKSVRYYSVPEDIRNEIISEYKSLSNEIPYFSDVKASAGYGCMNEDNCEEYINVPMEYSKKGNVAIHVDGDSMSPALETDDVIIVDTNSTEFVNNKIVVINYNGDLYVKMLKKEKDQIQLVSVNPYYPNIKVKNTDIFKIVGKVVFSFRKYN